MLSLKDCRVRRSAARWRQPGNAEYDGRAASNAMIDRHPRLYRLCRDVATGSVHRFAGSNRSRKCGGGAQRRA
jgi:hypothetical protein